jgi:hypothetical protein
MTPPLSGCTPGIGNGKRVPGFGNAGPLPALAGMAVDAAAVGLLTDGGLLRGPVGELGE